MCPHPDRRCSYEGVVRRRTVMFGGQARNSVKPFSEWSRNYPNAVHTVIAPDAHNDLGILFLTAES